MDRDGLSRFFEVWGVSDDLGLQKPDPRLFAHVLSTAGVSPDRTVMLGDRLDYDVRPAKQAGMHAVWVLRGEAPDDPTPTSSPRPTLGEGLVEVPALLEAGTPGKARLDPSAFAQRRGWRCVRGAGCAGRRVRRLDGSIAGQS